jgi:alpha-1,2-mannosyltransferase
VHSLVSIAYTVVAVAGVIAILWLARRRALPGGRPTGGRVLLWVVAPLALGVILFDLVSLKLSGPPEAFWDFLQAYYPAGRAALHHDAAALKALIGVGAQGGFVNIPAVAYLFAPFGWLSPRMAALAFTIMGIGTTIAAWFLLIRLFTLELRERWLLALLFAVNGPLLNGVKFGNVSYFLILVLTVGLALMRAQRSTAAGIVLGAAAVLKPPLALFGLFFLLRRDWRGLAGFAALGAATVCLSLVLFGWTLNFYWWQTSVLQYSHNWLGGFSVQSIPAFLVRLHEPSAILLDWSAKVPPAGEKLLAQGITALIFLIGAFACFRRPSRQVVADEADAGQRRDLQYLLTICLCLVCSPLSWAHYYAWLLIPAAFFLGAGQALAASTPIRVVGWAAIILVTPLVLWPQPSASATPMTIFESLAVSHYLLGGLMWFGLIAWWLMRAGGRLWQAGPRRAAGAVTPVTSPRFLEVSKAPPPP